MEVEAFQRLDPESFYRRFIKNSVRPDGRGLRTVRPISIDVEVLSDKHVQGSALVALGSTKVLAGITSQIGQPGESTPLSGAIDVEVKLSPLSSTKFETGRPSEQAQTLGNFVKTSIVNAGALALEDLCIEAGAYAWKLRIAIISLSYDGNLTDASLLAAMAALMCLKLPQTQRVEDELFVTEDPPNRLQVRHIPVPLTCGVFDGAVITDPSLLEEDLLTTQITVTSTADGQVCGILKPGGSCASGDQLNTCIQLCEQHAAQLQGIMLSAVKVNSY